MTIPVFFAGPTFVGRRTLNIYMDGALARHPDAELIPLPWIGALSVDRSVEHFSRAIDRLLLARKLGLMTPRFVVGHSQGGVVAAHYGSEHLDTVMHTVLVGAPINGSWLSSLLPMFPAAHDLTSGSDCLKRLETNLPKMAGRVTVIFCPDERVMRGDSCYEPIPGVDNVLVGTKKQIDHFVRKHPHFILAGQIETQRHVNHLNELMIPELRGFIWSVVNEVSIAHGFEPDGVPDEQLRGGNRFLRRILA